LIIVNNFPRFLSFSRGGHVPSLPTIWAPFGRGVNVEVGYVVNAQTPPVEKCWRRRVSAVARTWTSTTYRSRNPLLGSSEWRHAVRRKRGVVAVIRPAISAPLWRRSIFRLRELPVVVYVLPSRLHFSDNSGRGTHSWRKFESSPLLMSLKCFSSVPRIVEIIKLFGSVFVLENPYCRVTGTDLCLRHSLVKYSKNYFFPIIPVDELERWVT
jgi:hypothetical protein